MLVEGPPGYKRKWIVVCTELMDQLIHKILKQREKCYFAPILGLKVREPVCLASARAKTMRLADFILGSREP